MATHRYKTANGTVLNLSDEDAQKRQARGEVLTRVTDRQPVTDEQYIDAVANETIDGGATAAREEELDAKARELEEREHALNEREKAASEADAKARTSSPEAPDAATASNKARKPEETKGSQK